MIVNIVRHGTGLLCDPRKLSVKFGKKKPGISAGLFPLRFAKLLVLVLLAARLTTLLALFVAALLLLAGLLATLLLTTLLTALVATLVLLATLVLAALLAALVLLCHFAFLVGWGIAITNNVIETTFRSIELNR
jgi:hypothetical protein